MAPFEPRMTVYLALLSLTVVCLLQSAGVEGSIIKVCGSRDLHQVIEEVCSLHKRSVEFPVNSTFIPLLTLLKRRKDLSQMSEYCCSEGCPRSYFSMFCD